MTVEEEKTCCTCKVLKPAGEFHVIRKSGKLRPYCRDCQRERARKNYGVNKVRILEANRRYRTRPENIAKHRARVRRWHYKTNYGITESDKRFLEQSQGNRCAICQTHFSELDQRRIHVDHCHSTGKIRGILCHCCNQVLAQAHDMPAVLKAAAKYLRRHGAK